jgi:hypothetical protein
MWIRVRRRKEKKMRRKIKGKGIMDISPFTQPEDVVLSNVSPKQFQIQQRICSTATVTAGTATVTATVVPNTHSQAPPELHVLPPLSPEKKTQSLP